MKTDISVDSLFLNSSLYSPVMFEEREIEEVIDVLFNSNIHFDCFCVECNKESTFKIDDSTPQFQSIHSGSPTYLKQRFLNQYNIPFRRVFECQRNNNHKYYFSFRIVNNEITKVGQYPSAASIEINNIKKYQKILSKDYREFSKALGLFSHGVGVGSFVYLRRIFENLIEEMRMEASKESNWDEEKYRSSRMDEKIMILSYKLPKILVDNRRLYSIVSKGIHELTEEECLSLFPNVKLAIELILDEKIYLIEKQEKSDSVRSFISATIEKFK